MEESETEFQHAVIIGASAGGVDALCHLVETLPANFGAPVLIAQHLDPRRPSQLVSILSQHTPLKVLGVEDRMEFAPGVIYVAPANHRVEFVDSTFAVMQDGDDRPLPSIDRILGSAAAAYGERLIAVILTGSGSDGASGAYKVKAAQGTVIIQDPRTAEFPSMPRSLAPTSVDFVRDLEEIGPLLVELIDDPAAFAPQPVEAGQELDEFLAQLQTRCNIDFGQYKKPTIMRRLHRRIVATNTRHLNGYIRYLEQEPAEYEQLVSSFLIKVTEFFRDAELFEYLRATVVPGIIEESRQIGRQLRIWSAGCSTGEEAYSLAILLAEALGDELNLFSIRIFATDINEHAVAFARRGIYSNAALKELPRDLVDRYFVRHDGEFEVNKLIRSMVIFGQHDLAQRSPFPSIDLILCRNVLIYFTPELQRRALQLFAYSLRNGGYLALGMSESTTPLSDYFAEDDQRLKVYRRCGEAAPIPLGPVDTSMFTAPRATATSAWSQRLGEVNRARQEGVRIRSSIDRTENLLFHLPVGVVLVDQNYDIRTINNLARVFLGIHGPAIGEDLLHLIRSTSLESLRDGIDQAFRRAGPIRIEGELTVETMKGEQLFIEITCHRQDVEENGESAYAVVIVLADVTEAVVERQRVAESRDQENRENQQLADRVGQLNRANQQLIDANRELAEANEEFRITYEQLLVSNEESQAASEEIETLNEELQTTNEELETLNEELQATVEELNATNEDMQARSLELQEQRRISDAERAQIEAILVSMGDAVIVVGPEGQVNLMNDACSQMFGKNFNELIFEDDSGKRLPREETPTQIASRGDSFISQFTLSGLDNSRRWFEVIGQPIRNGPENSGSVIVIRDITDRSLRRLQEEFVSIASHELRTPLTALRGYLELHQRQLPSGDERSQRHMTVALTMVQRLNRLVSDMLDVGRLQSGKFEISPELVNLGELISETVELVQSTAQDHEIKTEIPEDPLLATLDPMRIQQALLNLLTNAIVFSPTRNSIQLRLWSEGDQARVQVQDFGDGIPEEGRSRIFSRFYQGERGSNSAQRGLGLGLFISREIILAHRGEISLDSTAGEGSTFTITLPIRHSAG